MVDNEGYKGPRWQLYKYYSPYWYRYYLNIPVDIRDKVCLCKEFKSYDLNSKNGLPTCLCGGILHYMIFQCDSCSDIFLKDFRHPKFCILDPLCWNCIDENPSCSVHTRSPDSKISPPIYRVRKKYSQEDLTGVFDF